MIKSFSQFIFEEQSPNGDEIFSAYNGRYLFNVTKAYEMIKNNQIESRIEKYPNYYLRRYSDSDFSFADPIKMEKIRKEMRYEDPLGLLVRFRNPEDLGSEPEWILIDGNHRVRIAGDDGMDGKLLVVKNPDDVSKFMSFDPSVPHELFPDY